MHARRHAGGVGVPGHQVHAARTLAQQVFLHHALPQQVVGAQPGEGTCHLAGIQEAAFGHLRLQQVQLAFVDEQRQFTRLGEVGLGREQRHRGQALVLVTCHGGGTDGQQGTAQAVAGGVHLLVRHDGADGVHGGEEAFVQVVFHAHVVLGLARVLPGDGENGVALADQVLDHGVLGGEIQDVVLHDPGWHDQDRLRAHFLGRRAVLDQFHQVGAQHHLALGRGHIATDHELVADRGLFMAHLALHVFQRVLHAAYQVGTVFLDGALEHHRVGQGVVGRGHHAQPLACRERDPVGVVRIDAAHAGGGIGPPVFLHQEGLLHHVERPLLPGRISKAAIGNRGRQGLGRRDGRQARALGRLLHAVLHLVDHAAGGQLLQLLQVVHGLLPQQQLLAGRGRQVRRPIHQRHRVQRRRLAAGQLGDGGEGLLVQLVGRFFGNAQRAGQGSGGGMGITHGICQKYEILMSVAISDPNSCRLQKYGKCQ